ncbi:MAG: hypothetical protein K9N23_15505 [Akkermansiaceae bacterium]|nr:hypothetical protein [Akkermansiaceae bacterium]MCF7733095.1 hypothetical protein [Akkermansiaceae bacterium]
MFVAKDHGVLDEGKILRDVGAGEPAVFEDHVGVFELGLPVLGDGGVGHHSLFDPIDVSSGF